MIPDFLFMDLRTEYRVMNREKEIERTYDRAIAVSTSEIWGRLFGHQHVSVERRMVTPWVDLNDNRIDTAIGDWIKEER
jgi:hypothetical protein